MSPLQRTHEWLREHGYMVAKTEHWNHFAKCKQDLWGVIDTWALHIDRDLLIQSTTGDHHAERIHKMLLCPALPLLLIRHDVECWSWSLRGKAGKRKLWTRRVTAFTLRDGKAVPAGLDFLNVASERLGQP